tara:strand:- start:12096 stop:12305 length:210 start_codon:yes stop_codon:yes gene_type:complete
MKLDQFLKWKGLVSTGGEAKHLITSGVVSVNGLVETQRGRKLRPGDIVDLSNQEFLVPKTEPRSKYLDF